MSILRDRIEVLSRCYCFSSGGSSSPPASDPVASAAAYANAETAEKALEFNQTAYTNDTKPRQEKMDKLVEAIGNQQIYVGNQNAVHADAQWNAYKNIFAPLEHQVVNDATSIDSKGELARASGEAAAGVQAQFDNAAGQRRRAQVAMGINPNSGRALAADSEAQLGLAAAKAGAANNARLVARDRGITLRAGAANFGRNMPNTAANAYGIALTSGNSAVGNQGAAAAAANAGVGQMNQGYNTSINGNNSAGSILNQQYGNQIAGWSAQQQAGAASSAGIGQMVGQLGAAYMSMPVASSKKIKHHKRPINHGETLDKVKGTTVEAWKYKDGEGDGGEHVGPYAEDVREKFGDKAAPGGKAIDVISMMGITLSAVKGLAKQVDKIDSKVARLAAKRGVRGAQHGV